ncbi:MAG: hypothetical protein NT091_00930, partial [Candidatus Falkowbacteria bacterium]|nr:hypothetical protein [Candidatus Falkowbacteria bacterium]
MPLFFKKIFSQKVTLILATVFVCVFLVGGYYTNVAVAVSTSPTYVEAKEASDTRAEQASSYERLKAAKNTTQEELTAAAKALDELTTRTNKIIEGYQAANASDIAKSNAAKKTPDTETQNEVAKWLGVGVMAIIQAVGYLLVAVINMVVAIVNYQGYATEAAVITGWNTVLGLCNMFFIVILLVIAFSTILRKESYAAKALLGKLLIAAIIINFSKTICGVIIEISSAFMMSMISDLSSGQIANLLGLQNFGSFSNTSGNITGWSTLVAALLSGIFLVISFVVLLMLLATLVMRVAMLWIYIVMSPLAYFLSSFPAGSKYAGQWWSEFTSQVITGPILCFFIWLAFKIQFVDNGNLTTTSNLLGTGKTSDLSSTAFGNAPAVANQASQCPGDMIAYMCPENFKKFIISIAFLIGGLIITQKAGGAAGKIAGAGLNAIKSGARRYTGYGSVADRVSGVMAKRATRRKEKTSKAIESWDTGISGALN